MFDETLRNLRESKHLSQKQLAEALYISPSTISQYESGKIKPSHDNLERLAHFFNVSIDYLYGTSPVADLKNRMNSEYCNGVTVYSLVEKCMNISKVHRGSLLDVINGLEVLSRREK